MRVSIEDHIADVFDAAVAYVHALEELEAADAAAFTERHVRVESRFHDLRLSVNDECVLCDAGSCPGFIG